MSKFKIVGRDIENDVEVSETISADTSRDALAVAKSRGIEVRSIEQVNEGVGSSSSLSVGGAGGINIVNQNDNSGGSVDYVDSTYEFDPLYALLSFFCPGLGQLCKGELWQGIVWFFGVLLGYALLIIPGVIAHAFCIVDAGRKKD